MRKRIAKYILLSLMVFGLAASSLQAQEVGEQEETPFIHKGKVLTGFSMGFTNASRDSYNHEFSRELTRVALSLEGLYFISDHLGVGPILGYEFVYQDFVPTPPAPSGDIDSRWWFASFGAKAGWYIPAEDLFGTSSRGRSQFFVDGGASWLRRRHQSERYDFEAEPDYDFRLQLGTGLLIPLGKQIALDTRLGFQTHREEYHWTFVDLDGREEIRHRVKWPKEISLSVGLRFF